MAIYDISLQPLITRLGFSSDVKQCWYADDASGSGSLEAIKQWWLTEAGPNLEYYPNAKKCWLITKPEKVEGAQVIFEGLRLTSLRRVKGIWGQPWAPENIWKNTSVAKCLMQPLHLACGINGRIFSEHSQI